MKRIIAALTIALVAAAMPADESSERDAVETIDARTFRGKVLSLSEKALELKQDGETRTVPAGDVSGMELSEASSMVDRRGQCMLVTADGGRLAVSNFAISDGKATFNCSLNGGPSETTVPLGSVRTVYLPKSHQTVREIRKQLGDLLSDETTRDIIYLLQGDSPVAIKGVLKAVSNAQISFSRKGADHKAPLSSVAAIRLAKLEDRPASSAGKLLGRDGSEIFFTSMTLDGDKARVRSALLGEYEVRRRAIASVTFTSDRVVRLGDLKPSAVSEHGFFDHVFKHRKNTSVGGGPLKLAKATYAEGLGVHSFCE